MLQNILIAIYILVVLGVSVTVRASSVDLFQTRTIGPAQQALSLDPLPGK